MDEMLVSGEYLESHIPRRRPETHKGDYGKVFIIGGSVGYTGAPVIAARSALRTGAGIVFLAAPRCIYPVQASRCFEEVCVPAESDDEGYAASAADALCARAEACDACVLGPGLGRGENARRITYELIRRSTKPLLIDADGINAVAGNIDILRERRGETVLTPHEAEFMRLGGDLAHGREFAARSLAARLGAVVVLKGHRTLVASPGGELLKNTTGNPGMAVGGSGDALSGVIGSLIAQGLGTLEAAACGVFIHGLAGDLAAAELGEYGMLPGDLIERLPYTLKRFSSRDYTDG